MGIIAIGNQFEYVGNRFKNTDLIRFFNDFYKSSEEQGKGIGRIKSPNEGEFFSQEYLDFLSNTIGNEKGLRDFLAWLREELLTREHLREKLILKYTPRQFVEILFLLFNNQRNLEFNPEKPVLEDLLNRKVYDILNEIDSGLSEQGLNVFLQLEKTINEGFFPISSQGELLIFVNNMEPGIARFLAFPSGRTIVANKTGGIIECEDDIEEDGEEGLKDNFLDWFSQQEDKSTMVTDELEERLDIYKSLLDYHTGKGNILSKNSAAAYEIEYETYTVDFHDADSDAEIGKDLRKYLDEIFKNYLEKEIDSYNKILKLKKTSLSIVQ